MLLQPEDTPKYLASEIRKNMETIIKYYDSINIRTCNIQKELYNLRYLLDVKNSRAINDLPNDDKKQYQTKQKMYLGKLNQKQILTPKESTLNYYKIKFVNDVYIIDE